MPIYPSLPWPSINDFLVEIGSIHNQNEFGHRVLLRLEDLVPYDNNGIFGITDPRGRVFIGAAIVDSSKWVELHNNYYWKTMPDIRGSRPIIIDWRQWRHTEYGADFINPQGIKGSLVTPLLNEAGHFLGAFGINRIKGMGNFTEQDLMIMEVIQPHLSNFLKMHVLLGVYDNQLPDASAIASEYKNLTTREAEIAALICRRFSTGMIASRLSISPATVYRHIANMFAKLNVFNRDELIEKLCLKSNVRRMGSEWD